MKKRNFLIFAMAFLGSLSAFAADFDGRLLIYCEALPSENRVHTAKSVEISGDSLKLKELNSSTGKYETKSIIPSAGCIIEADQRIHININDDLGPRN
jgi:hypothetical protein